MNWSEWLPSWPGKGNVLWMVILIFGFAFLNESIMFNAEESQEIWWADPSIDESITAAVEAEPTNPPCPQNSPPASSDSDSTSSDSSSTSVTTRKKLNGNRIAVIIAWFARKSVPQQLLESFLTFGYNADLLDYLVFMEKGTKAQRIVRDYIEHNKLTNIYVFDDYWLPNLGQMTGEQFIKAKLKSIFVNYLDELPDMDFSFDRRFCDVRPFFGEIYYEWTKEYSHWAWSDKDSYVGNLTDYLNDGRWLDEFDVITLQRLGEWHLFTAGQLTIMKNDLGGRWYWTKSDMQVLYRNFNQEPKPHVMDEFWYSRPVVWADDITYLQTYVQTSKAGDTVWAIWCEDEINHKNCIPKIVRWQDEIKKKWWEEAFEDTTTKWPQNLDHFTMDDYVRFKSPNLEDAGLGGFMTIYQTRNGSWWREPIKRKYFDRIQGRYVIMESGLVHSRSVVCQVKPDDLEYFKKTGKHHGCINSKNDPGHRIKDN